MKNIKSPGDFAIVGLMIFVSVSPFLEGSRQLLGYILIGVFFLTRRRNEQPESAKIILTIVGISFGIVIDLTSSSAFALHALGTHILFTAGLIAGWLAAVSIPYHLMAEILAKWAFIFAALSLVGVAAYSFFPSIVGLLPTYSYHDSTNHTMGFANILTFADGTIVQRNAGIASEPGLFQIVLNLGAAAMLNFSKERISLAWFGRFATIGFAIVTTNSTTGLLLFAGLLIYGAFKSGKIGLSLGIFVILAWEAIRSEFTHQKENKLVGSTAFETRSSPAQEILGDVISRPFGVGNITYNSEYEAMNWGGYDSLSQVVIRYGIPLAFLLCLFLLRNAINFPLPLLVVIMTLASQPIWFTPLVAYFYYCKSWRSDAENKHRENLSLGECRA